MPNPLCVFAPLQCYVEKLCIFGIISSARERAVCHPFPSSNAPHLWSSPNLRGAILFGCGFAALRPCDFALTSVSRPPQVLISAFDIGCSALQLLPLQHPPLKIQPPKLFPTLDSFCPTSPATLKPKTENYGL